MYGLQLGQRLLPGPNLTAVPSTSPWAATATPSLVVRATTPLPSPSDLDPFPTTPEHDCTWLDSPELEGIPVKLIPRKGLAASSSPYRFVRVERQPDNNVSALADVKVWFSDRARERSLPMSELHWVMCTGSGQIVIMTSGENRSQLYWTLGAVDDEMMCRLEPKIANAPSVMLPSCKLAQVFKAKRS